jgi:hypothetical protein
VAMLSRVPAPRTTRSGPLFRVGPTARRGATVLVIEGQRRCWSERAAPPSGRVCVVASAGRSAAAVVHDGGGSHGSCVAAREARHDRRRPGPHRARRGAA